jgi:hypothetical protein
VLAPLSFRVIHILNPTQIATIHPDIMQKVDKKALQKVYRGKLSCPWYSTG